MTRTALTSEFVAVRCMWLKDTFNWRATLTQATILSPRRILQHAEHYFRLIAAAQAAQFQAQKGDVRATGESGPGGLGDDDDDLGGLPDRFASPGQQERQAFTDQTNAGVRPAPQSYVQREPLVRREV